MEKGNKKKGKKKNKEKKIKSKVSVGFKNSLIKLIQGGIIARSPFECPECTRKVNILGLGRTHKITESKILFEGPATERLKNSCVPQTGTNFIKTKKKSLKKKEKIW